MKIFLLFVFFSNWLFAVSFPNEFISWNKFIDILGAEVHKQSVARMVPTMNAIHNAFKREEIVYLDKLHRESQRLRAKNEDVISKIISIEEEVSSVWKEAITRAGFEVFSVYRNRIGFRHPYEHEYPSIYRLDVGRFFALKYWKESDGYFEVDVNPTLSQVYGRDTLVVLPHPKLDHAKARFVPFLTGSSFTRFYYVHALPEHVSADESNAFNAVQEAFMIRLCKLSREEARDLYYPGPWCGMATEAAHGHISKKQISTLRDGSSSFTDREIRRGYTTELAR